MGLTLCGILWSVWNSQACLEQGSKEQTMSSQPKPSSDKNGLCEKIVVYTKYPDCFTQCCRDDNSSGYNRGSSSFKNNMEQDMVNEELEEAFRDICAVQKAQREKNNQCPNIHTEQKPEIGMRGPEYGSVKRNPEYESRGQTLDYDSENERRGKVYTPECVSRRQDCEENCRRQNQQCEYESERRNVEYGSLKQGPDYESERRDLEYGSRRRSLDYESERRDIDYGSRNRTPKNEIDRQDFEYGSRNRTPNNEMEGQGVEYGSRRRSQDYESKRQEIEYGSRRRSQDYDYENERRGKMYTPECVRRRQDCEVNCRMQSQQCEYESERQDLEYGSRNRTPNNDMERREEVPGSIRLRRDYDRYEDGNRGAGYQGLEYEGSMRNAEYQGPDYDDGKRNTQHRYPDNYEARKLSANFRNNGNAEQWRRGEGFNSEHGRRGQQCEEYCVRQCRQREYENERREVAFPNEYRGPESEEEKRNGDYRYHEDERDFRRSEYDRDSRTSKRGTGYQTVCERRAKDCLEKCRREDQECEGGGARRRSRMCDVCVGPNGIDACTMTSECASTNPERQERSVATEEDGCHTDGCCCCDCNNTTITVIASRPTRQCLDDGVNLQRSNSKKIPGSNHGSDKRSERQTAGSNQYYEQDPDLQSGAGEEVAARKPSRRFSASNIERNVPPTRKQSPRTFEVTAYDIPNEEYNKEVTDHPNVDASDIETVSNNDDDMSHPITENPELSNTTTNKRLKNQSSQMSSRRNSSNIQPLSSGQSSMRNIKVYGVNPDPSADVAPSPTMRTISLTGDHYPKAVVSYNAGKSSSQLRAHRINRRSSNGNNPRANFHEEPKTNTIVSRHQTAECDQDPSYGDNEVICKIIIASSQNTCVQTCEPVVCDDVPGESTEWDH